MNINQALFTGIIDTLIKDFPPDQPFSEPMQRKLDWCATEFSSKALVNYFKSLENPHKTSEALLKAVCYSGAYTRYLCENSAEDGEERLVNIFSYLTNFDIWSWAVCWTPNQSALADEVVSKISHFLTYQNIAFEETERFCDLVTVLYATFIFAFRFKNFSIEISDK